MPCGESSNTGNINRKNGRRNMGFVLGVTIGLVLGVAGAEKIKAFVKDKLDVFKNVR